VRRLQDPGSDEDDVLADLQTFGRDATRHSSLSLPRRPTIPLAAPHAPVFSPPSLPGSQPRLFAMQKLQSLPIRPPSLLARPVEVPAMAQSPTRTAAQLAVSPPASALSPKILFSPPKSPMAPLEPLPLSTPLRYTFDGGGDAACTTPQRSGRAHKSPRGSEIGPVVGQGGIFLLEEGVGDEVRCLQVINS
jgi:hypothetical protein